MSSDDGYISVQYQPAGDAYDDLMNATNAINTVFQELERIIPQLSQIWKGTSQDMWMNLQNKWNNLIEDMQTTLGKNAGILSEMMSNYSTTENNLTAQWQEIGL